MSASNLDVVRRYVAALASGTGPEAVAAFFAPDVVQEEFPNRLVPNGARRDLAALKLSRERGLALLRGETYAIESAVASGDDVAVELAWTGTIAADAGPFQAGQVLRARFAIFLRLRDGLIVRQHNYDCFEPW